MDKREYFDTLLKRDFIKYVLLRAPRLTSQQVSEKLKLEIATERLYRKMKSAIMPVCDKYLALNRIMQDGNVVDILPDWLNLSLLETIAGDYRHLIEKEYASENYLPAILFQIERLTWLQGVDDMADNLRQFVADVKKLSEDYANIPAPVQDDYDLQQKYEEAKRVTIREYIMGDNDDDVAVFRGLLLAYAQDTCEMLLYRQLAKCYADIADSPEIHALISKFDGMHREAKDKLPTLVVEDYHADWDAEYARLVPVEFFERNIDDIDGAMAFHMVLLQAFSRHEKILVDEEFLTANGELRIFTSPHFHGIDGSNMDFVRLFQ